MAADSRAKLSAAASSSAAPVAGPIGSPGRAAPRAKKRVASKAELAAVAPRTDKAKKLETVDVVGVDSATLDKIKEAKTPLELTRNVRALEMVADQHTLLSREIKATVLDLDTRFGAAMQRIQVLEQRLSEVDETIVKSNAMQARATLNTEAKLQAMADEGNAWETKLDERLKKKNEEFQSKLDETADMFRKCDGILGEIKALQPAGSGPAVATIPVAAGPSLEPKALLLVNEQLSLLRGRMDSMQAAMNTLQQPNQDMQDMGTNQVTMQLNVQEVSVRLDSVCQWAHTENAKLESHMRDMEARQGIQLAQTSAWLQQAIAAGACHCPANCKAGGGHCGGTGGQGQSYETPAGRASAAWLGGGTEGAAQSPAGARPGRQPLIPPRRGSDDGDGSDGGDGGDGGDPYGGPRGFDIFSDVPGHDGRAPRPITKLSRSPFDTKAASAELPRYNGREKQAIWRKKVMNYLHSKCSDMAVMLKFAEQCTEVITPPMLAEARRSGALRNTFSEPEALGYHLWGFLNVNLVEDAWDIFDNVDYEQGFEVWRVVNQDLTQKTQSELLNLEDAVLTPPQVSDLAKIPQALVNWDAAHREYKDAGGTALTPDRQVGAIMRLLPAAVRDRALWDFESFKDSPAKLRQWLKEKAKIFSQGSFAQARRRGLNILDNEQYEAMTSEELHNLSEMDDEQIHAFVRRRFPPKAAGGDRRPIGAAPRAPPPPREVPDARCSNCGDKGHTGRECPKPKVEMRDRVCFKCNKPGHQARQCPNAADKAKALTEEPAAEPTVLSLSGPRRQQAPAGQPRPTFLGCLGSEDFVPAHRNRRAPVTSVARARREAPRPQGCTLGDCIPTSVFTQLKELDMGENSPSDNDEPEDVVCGGCLPDPEDMCLVPASRTKASRCSSSCGCSKDAAPCEVRADAPHERRADSSPEQRADGLPELAELREFPPLPERQGHRLSVTKQATAELKDKIAVSASGSRQKIGRRRPVPDLEPSDDEADCEIPGPKSGKPESTDDQECVDEVEFDEWLKAQAGGVDVRNIETHIQARAKRRELYEEFMELKRLNDAEASGNARVDDARTKSTPWCPSILTPAKANREEGVAYPLNKVNHNISGEDQVRGVETKATRKAMPALSEKLSSRAGTTEEEESKINPACGRRMRSAATTGQKDQVINLFSPVEVLNALPSAPEPEFIEVEVTLDTGATVHAADRIDFPGHEVRESEGSRAGQRFQGASGKFINNEGEINVTMIAPGCVGELMSCFQVAKVTRPLLSVSRMTESGEITVLCKRDVALVLDKNQKTLAEFKRNGGLYTCMMQVRNPRFQPFTRQAP